jgi:hypothetical protein
MNTLFVWRPGHLWMINVLAMSEKAAHNWEEVNRAYAIWIHVSLWQRDQAGIGRYQKQCLADAKGGEWLFLSCVSS